MFGIGKVLEDLVKRGTAEQDFQRLVKKLNEVQTPTAKALLGGYNAGRLTAETLADGGCVHGEGRLPWHEGQWKSVDAG